MITPERPTDFGRADLFASVQEAMNRFRSFALCGIGVLLLTSFSASAAESPDFANEIYPILERSCFGCHGPEKQKSGYRLDVRTTAIRGGDSGRVAIIPHNGNDSPLIHYISGEDEDMRMPPEKSTAQALSEQEVELLRTWIDSGPSWPDELANESEVLETHWSLKPLLPSSIPESEVNPIDSFIHAKLKEISVAPSPEADRRTLIRRLYFDLIGLPPTPEEMDAFISDPDPAAYDHMVDQLLASPRHGERWARHWFDAIQFADSHGYEHDIGRYNAWPYRDYFIQSLNDDKPWARLIREQLAADYFYPDEPKLVSALGYLGAGPFDLSTFITAEVTFDYLARDALVTQVMSSFVSTTANCARCHNHKFDLIPQADYYALQAVFSGVIKGDLAYDADVAVKREREQWQSILDAIQAQDRGVLLKPENERLVQDWLSERAKGAQWLPLDVATFQSTDGAELTRLPDGTIVSGGPRPDKATYTVTGTTLLSTVTALRLNISTVADLPKMGPGRHEGNFHLSEISLRIFRLNELNPITVALRRASADFNQKDWEIEKAIDANAETAWGIHPAEGKPHVAVFELKEPLTLQPGDQLSIALSQLHGEGHLIGAFDLALTDASTEQVVVLPPKVESDLDFPTSEISERRHARRSAAVLQFKADDALATLPEPARIYTAATSVDIPNGEDAPKPATLPAPKPVHRMERGDFDKPAEVVEPGTLSAIAALPARFALANPNDEASRRAALADWIASPENVLTWRSIVNRVWHHHFGKGLCDTPSDLGRMGGTPSHPELIDWLAVWFRDEANGSLKALHRLIVTSETYRQSSAHREEAAAMDGDNRLLWRQNRHRLDADAFRDYGNAISGKLDLTMGGPGIQHFTKGPGPQITPTLDYSAYDWNAEGAGRRSIYRFVWRGIADPFMESLDFPDLGLLSPKRGYSSSSLQALALYNNDFVLHLADVMATRIQTEAPELDAQITRAARLAWLRPLTADEEVEFRDYAEKHGLAALCRILLNSNEYLFVD